MLGPMNRTLLLIMIMASTVASACSDTTSPVPHAPDGGTAAGATASSDTASPATASPSTVTSGQPAGDSVRRLVFARDDAIWQSTDSSAQPVLLLRLPSSFYAAAVSRSGSIAFVPAATNQVCIAAPGDAAPRCVSPGYYNISGLAWSPDGTQIVFSGEPEMAVCDLAPPCLAPRMNLLALSAGSMAARSLVVAHDGVYALGASWSPDGAVIAFAMGGGIWLVNPDGSQRRVLTAHVGGLYEVNGVRWSPDGRKLAVSMQPSDWCSWYCDTAVGTINADGSGLRVIATATEASNVFVGKWPHGAPVWSPDGSRLVFGRSDCSAGWDPCREQELVVDAAGGTPQLLLDDATLLAWQGH